MTALSAIQTTTQPPPTPTALVPASDSSTASTAFSTVLDALNPLQHIPIVSSIYRATQGSSISSVSQVAGDTLYGGLVGGAISSFVSSIADVAVKAVTGSGITDHVIATAEAAVAPSTTNTTTATPLVAIAPADAPPVTPAKDTSLNAQVDSAVHTILRNQVHPERVAAQYKRAQTLDIGNKLLVNIG